MRSTKVPGGGRQTWTWIVAAWSALALFDASQTVLIMRSEGMHHAWATLFLVTVAKWIPWAAATPIVLRLARRFPPTSLRPLATWLVHIVACAAIGLVFAAWSASLQILVNPFSDAHPAPYVVLWLQEFYSGSLSFAVLYATILAAGYGVETRARLAFERTETARLNERLSQAQLDALRRQIEPHFLFNALNAIAGLARAGRVDAAVQSIADLSVFLRQTLGTIARDRVVLRDEIEFATAYLNIQHARFGDRLRVSIDIPSELDDAEVPSLILQPILENAIKHGIARSPGGGAIAIDASLHEGSLVISVRNDGPPVCAREPDREAGIGLANVRTRLLASYGRDCSLELTNVSGGVAVTLSLPHAREPVLSRA